MSDSRGSALQNELCQRLENKPLLLMTHLVVGYPSIEENWEMLEAMACAGVDAVELQMPFSEPIADGPLFVKANHEAIRSGTTWQDYFDLAARAAERFAFPIVFMGYYNSVFQMGLERFCSRLSGAGIQGFIIPDLPPEEAGDLSSAACLHGLDPVLIMAPTNSDVRLAEIGQQASGFVYCASRLGVTGRPTDLTTSTVTGFMQRCRAATAAPLGLGFGIRTADDVRAVRGAADMAIIGTAGLNVWQERGVAGYREFLKLLVAATEEE